MNSRRIIDIVSLVFFFVIVIICAVDAVKSRREKRANAQRAREVMPIANAAAVIDPAVVLNADVVTVVVIGNNHECINLSGIRAQAQQNEQK